MIVPTFRGYCDGEGACGLKTSVCSDQSCPANTTTLYRVSLCPGTAATDCPTPETQLCPGGLCDDDGVNCRGIQLRDGDGNFLSSARVLATTELGATDKLSLFLTQPPTAPVTLSLSVNDTTEATVSPSMVTFSAANYSDPLVLTVTGQADLSNTDGTVGYRLHVHGAVSADPDYAGRVPVPEVVVGVNSNVMWPIIQSFTPSTCALAGSNITINVTGVTESVRIEVGGYRAQFISHSADGMLLVVLLFDFGLWNAVCPIR